MAVGAQRWGGDVVVSRDRNSTTITTLARRQIKTPVRSVQGSERVAMVDPGAEVTKVNVTEQPRTTTRPAVTVSSRWSAQRGVATLQRTARICARHM
jgi:hypothetical protein